MTSDWRERLLAATERQDLYDDVRHPLAIVAVADIRAALAAAAHSPQEGGGGAPAWSRDLPPTSMPETVKIHAVGAGLALRHALDCPMRKVIYDNHGDPCNCRESERRCERTAEVAYFAGIAAPSPADVQVDREALRRVVTIGGLASTSRGWAALTLPQAVSLIYGSATERFADDLAALAPLLGEPEVVP